MPAEHQPLRFLGDLQFTSFTKQLGQSSSEYVDMFSPVCYSPKKYEINIFDNSIFNFEDNDYSEATEVISGGGNGSVIKYLLDIGKSKQGAPVYFSVAITRIKDGDVFYRLVVYYASLSQNIEITPWDMWLGTHWSNGTLAREYDGNCWKGQNIVLFGFGGTSFPRYNTQEGIRTELHSRLFLFSQMIIDFQTPPGGGEPVEVIESDSYWGRAYLVETALTAEEYNYAENTDNFILHGEEKDGFNNPNMTFNNGYRINYSGSLTNEDYMLYNIGEYSDEIVYSSIQLLFSTEKSGGYTPTKPGESAGEGGKIPDLNSDYPEGTGGEYGSKKDFTSDDNEDIPPTPEEGLCDSGFINMYVCDSSKIQQLKNFLWNNESISPAIEKLYNNPIEAIIGLSILPVNPDLIQGTNENISMATIDTGINTKRISKDVVEFSLGTCKDTEALYGDFVDFSETQIYLQLPFCDGLFEIDPRDFWGNTLRLFAKINLSTGDIIYFIKGKDRTQNSDIETIKYIFTGQCKIDIPFSGREGSLKNWAKTIGGGVAMVAGVATANPLIAAGGLAALASGSGGALAPKVQHGGNLGGSVAFLNIRYPRLIIKAPKIVSNKDFYKLAGKKSMYSKKIGDLEGTGMNQFAFFKLSNLTCTDEEKKEIEGLLKEGVIL